MMDTASYSVSVRTGRGNNWSLATRRRPIRAIGPANALYDAARRARLDIRMGGPSDSEPTPDRFRGTKYHMPDGATAWVYELDEDGKLVVGPGVARTAFSIAQEAEAARALPKDAADEIARLSDAVGELRERNATLAENVQHLTRQRDEARVRSDALLIERDGMREDLEREKMAHEILRERVRENLSHWIECAECERARDEMESLRTMTAPRVPTPHADKADRLARAYGMGDLARRAQEQMRAAQTNLNPYAGMPMWGGW